MSSIEPLSLARESIKAIKQRDDREENEGKPRRVRLEAGFEYQFIARDVLSLQSGVEAYIGDADGHPGQELCDGDKILKPGEDFCGAGGAGHVSYKGDGSRKEDAVVGYAFLRTSQEDPRRLFVLRQGIEVARACVEESVSGGCGGDEDHCVDD